MFLLKDNDGKEIIKLILQLINKKTLVLISVSVSFLKENIDILPGTFSHTINISFKEGLYPRDLKITQVIPIQKRNKTHLWSNYRVISLW